ncbi:hypothetical protein [Jeotgalibaca porci]|uniref:hypothetical protein n=1 Tax=Jeotgalibaca porci TaxID=1868793 RepID=UPI00359F36E8
MYRNVLYKEIVITYLVDGNKFRMIFPYRKDGAESEILKEAEQEMIKKGFDDFELLGWELVEEIC